MNAIFDITEIGSDKLFGLIGSINIEFMEIALIDKDEEIIADYHYHDWFDISFIMKGSLEYHVEDRVYNVAKGDVVIIGPGRSHREICDPDSDFEVLFICIHFTRSNKRINIIKQLNIQEITKISDLKEIYEIFSAILREVTYRESGYLLKINAQIYNLLVTLYRSSHAADRKAESIKKLNELRKSRNAEDIRNYLDNNYSRKTSLKKLSRTFYLSPQYISALFKEQTGFTPIKYLNIVRINRAKELLAEENSSISEIAHNVGFNNIHYFYKVFKQIEGKTPVQYVEKIAKFKSFNIL